jgi:hypothetical protein
VWAEKTDEKSMTKVTNSLDTNKKGWNGRNTKYYVKINKY